MKSNQQTKNESERKPSKLWQRTITGCYTLPTTRPVNVLVAVLKNERVWEPEVGGFPLATCDSLKTAKLAAEDELCRVLTEALEKLGLSQESSAAANSR